jgi:hypothetical protein
VNTNGTMVKAQISVKPVSKFQQTAPTTMSSPFIQPFEWTIGCQRFCFGYYHDDRWTNYDVALVGAADGTVQDTTDLRVMKLDEAMRVDPVGWKAAVEDEYARMVKNGVFKAIPRSSVPRGRRVISTTWAMKQKANGVKRARLVARGFQQVAGQDYDPEAGRYAPVVSLIAFKICCVLILMMRMFAHIADVRGAFLTGDLSGSPVYIDVPQGMEQAVQKSLDEEAKRTNSKPLSFMDIVLMLLKSLYGLVQSSHLFWRKQSTTMTDKLELERSIADYCLYYKWINDKLFLSINWVDDIIMAYGDEAVIVSKKAKLSETFEIDDIGPMNEFVGCKIEHDREAGTMKFTQPILIQSFENEFELPTKTTGGTPAAPGTTLMAHKDEQMLTPDQQSQFRKAIGKLWYLARMSRHDLLHAVRDLSKYNAGAWMSTWKTALRAMKYCAETPNRGLVFKPKRRWTGRDFEFDLVGYSDSNYASDADNRRSVMSCQVYLEECCVSARSKQMAFVTLSVTEAELAAAVECAQDLMYAKSILEDLKLKVKLPMKLYVDNEAAVNMVKNYMSGGRTRHTAVRINFLRELHEAGNVVLTNIAGVDNRADIGTKNLDKATFERHGIPMHGEDEYYKTWKRSTGAWEGVASVALGAVTVSAPVDHCGTVLDTKTVQDAVLDTGLTGPVPTSSDDVDVQGHSATLDQTDDVGPVGKSSRAAIPSITNEN